MEDGSGRRSPKSLGSTGAVVFIDRGTCCQEYKEDEGEELIRILSE